MNVKELAQTIGNQGKQNIGFNNELHPILTGLSDYEFSQVNDELNKVGLTIVWDMFTDVYEIY